MLRRHAIAITVGLAVGLMSAACASSGPIRAPTSTPSPDGPAPAIPPARTAAPTTGPTDAPEPTPEPSPDPFDFWNDEIEYWADEAFAQQAHGKCVDTRPGDVQERIGPMEPPDKAPAYGKVHMVVAELIGTEGESLDPPPVPAELFYYNGTWHGYPIEYVDLVAAGPDEVDLLACIVMRTGESAVYSGAFSPRVHTTDGVVWMVDAVSGQTVGRPWVLPFREFPSLLGPGDTKMTETGDLELLVPSGSFIAQQIVSFLGRVTPTPGAFQQLSSYSDDEATLPEGMQLYDQTFVVRLVVFGDQVDRVAFVEVFCAPDGTITGESLRIATDAPLELGRFEARSAAMALEGDFRSALRAAGTIRARDGTAGRCGIPGDGEWVAYHSAILEVIKDDQGYLLEVIPRPEE